MRKRFLSTVLVLIMLLSLAPMSALADDTFRSGDFTFVIETGVACVKKYNGSSSSVSVPSKVDYDGVTYKVRNIHQDAFKNCTTIQKLVLPETVNRIGKQAFANCTSLNSITINGDLNGVYTVDNTFYNIGANSDYLNVLSARKSRLYRVICLTLHIPKVKDTILTLPTLRSLIR